MPASSVHPLATLAAVAFGLSFAYGWACLLLPSGRRHWLTLAVVTLGLSLGGLTLAMFWIAWLRPGRLALGVTLLVCGALAAAGLGLSRHSWRPDGRMRSNGPSSWWRNPALAAAAAAVLLIAPAIVFNATYWPFVDTDALAIYAPLGKALYRTGALPVGDLYESYPLMLPLGYAFTHLAAGGVHEYWAKLIPAVMALGAVGAAAALAREMRSPRAGLAAAALVVLTPLFDRWASSGYADVPASFYVVLAALSAWRWLDGRGWQDALLTGIMAGLAIWTKSSALTLLVPILVLILLAVWTQRRGERSSSGVPLRTGQAGLMAAGFLAAAGPWAARNVTQLGFLLADTAWTELARRDLPSLLVMLHDWPEFQLSGWLFVGGLGYAAVRSIAAARSGRWGWAALLAFGLPFLAGWWWLASYDVRFLVTVVPLLAAPAACMADDLAEAVARRLGRGRRAGVWTLALLTLAMMPLALHKTVDGKRAILADPCLSDGEKHRIRLGGLYEVALAINGLADGSRIVGVPSLALYHIERDRFSTLSEARAEGLPSSLAAGFDYAVYRFPEGGIPDWAQALAPILRTDDGFSLYATADPAAPPSEGSGRADAVAAGRTVDAAP